MRAFASSVVQFEWWNQDLAMTLPFVLTELPAIDHQYAVNYRVLGCRKVTRILPDSGPVGVQLLCCLRLIATGDDE